MSYDYQKTSLNLYRAIFFKNFDTDVSSYLKPDEELANSEEIAPILHPAYAPKSSRRPADIEPKGDGKYHPDTGGTSVFDHAGVLKSSDGDFFLPEGTEIPPDIKIKNDGVNKRLGATHYTIMPQKPLPKLVLEANLNQLVRNAIKRQYEKARGK